MQALLTALHGQGLLRQHAQATTAGHAQSMCKPGSRATAGSILNPHITATHTFWMNHRWVMFSLENATASRPSAAS